MDLFLYDDYKAYIQDWLEEQERGRHTALARAAGCQSSFLSHVLNGPVHLTPDHAAALAQFWGFDAPSCDYFVTLVMAARAGAPALVNHLRERLRSLREERQNLAHRFVQAEQLSDEASLLRYYGAWYYSAIHVALMIPSLRQATALAQRLSLPLALVEEALRDLGNMGLAVARGGRWEATSRHLHLPKASPITAVAQGNWRDVGKLKLGSGPGEHSFYTGVHALAKTDLAKLKGMISEFLAAVQGVVATSTPEELTCLAVDFYTV